jgi:hypothetical protein
LKVKDSENKEFRIDLQSNLDVFVKANRYYSVYDLVSDLGGLISFYQIAILGLMMKVLHQSYVDHVSKNLDEVEKLGVPEVKKRFNERVSAEGIYNLYENLNELKNHQNERRTKILTTLKTHKNHL